MGRCKFLLNSLCFVLLVALILTSGCSCPSNSYPKKTGYALAIGLNELNPDHYNGWSGKLPGCELDAKDMKAIAASQGFAVEIVMTSQATRDYVLRKLDDYAKNLKSGDLLVVSYSGHGGQVPDLNGDEEDGLDETWCLHDGELLDDELYGEWIKFKPGVRIFVLSDSCHSGTVLKMVRSDLEKPDPLRMKEFEDNWRQLRIPQRLERTKILTYLENNKDLQQRIRPLIRGVAEKPIALEDVKDTFVSRSVPPEILVKTYQLNQKFYDKIGMAAPKEDPEQIKASIILISGCEDTQTSADLGFNGLFTSKLKLVWKNGDFNGDHRQFHEAIKAMVLNENSDQSPKFFVLGMSNQDKEKFIRQRPYKIQ